MPACQNCSNELKIAVFGGMNLPYKPRVISFINDFHRLNAATYCIKCGQELLREGQAAGKTAQADLQVILNQHIHRIPILSLQAPNSWEFTPLELVTGQSVTGTGVFSEFASSWTDFFGSQSKVYNQKILGGEEICKAQLRMKCIEAGGNAILAADIDYAEVGGQKGMLMVCMTGTAVRLDNLGVLGADTATSISSLMAGADAAGVVLRYPDIIQETDTMKLTAEMPRK